MLLTGQHVVSSNEEDQEREQRKSNCAALRRKMSDRNSDMSERQAPRRYQKWKFVTRKKGVWSQSWQTVPGPQTRM